jgi:hypothetical protein
LYSLAALPTLRVIRCSDIDPLNQELALGAHREANCQVQLALATLALVFAQFVQSFNKHLACKGFRVQISRLLLLLLLLLLLFGFKIGQEVPCYRIASAAWPLLRRWSRRASMARTLRGLHAPITASILQA